MHMSVLCCYGTSTERKQHCFTMTVGSPEDKERVKKGLSGVLEGVDPERRKRVMGAVKENLLTM